MHDDEAALVARAAGGDRRAFAVLVARHQGRLRHFLARVVGTHAADDAAQDAFVKAWLALGRYRGEAGFGAWLAGIGWRAALDLRRRAGETAWHAERDEVAEGPGAARVELERALAAPTETERAALVLTHGHGWSHSETAAILGLPLGTLKSLDAADTHQSEMAA